MCGSVFFGFATATVTWLIAVPALVRGRARCSLAFHSLHTGKSLDLFYLAKSRYLPGAKARIDYLPRNFRADTAHPIDPKLFDLLASLRRRLRSGWPYLAISGYRLPETNVTLHATTEGIATRILHMVDAGD